MKKILITGAGSYIGTSFERYITENYPGEYVVDTVDMIDGSWRERSFAGYDSVFHVAGIAHQKETKDNAHLYYEVNRDLAIETAMKARADGVKQFIFLSSMSVYGKDTGVITKETNPDPKSHYGKSKWQAEQGITSLSTDAFKVCVLRPPMVYGSGCKGNYQMLIRIAEVSPVLPLYKNRRSMIFIDRLVKYVKEYIDSESCGLYIPQDDKYSCTSEILIRLREQTRKRYITVKWLNPFIKLLAKCTVKGRKAFGDLIYQDDGSCVLSQ